MYVYVMYICLYICNFFPLIILHTYISGMPLVSSKQFSLVLLLSVWHSFFSNESVYVIYLNIYTIWYNEWFIITWHKQLLIYLDLYLPSSLPASCLFFFPFLHSLGLTKYLFIILFPSISFLVVHSLVTFEQLL